MKRKTILIGILIGIIAAGTMTLVSCSRKGTPETGGKREILYYTCSMHPQIRQDKPGDCPICNMRLNPVYKEETSPAPPDAITGIETASLTWRVSSRA